MATQEIGFSADLFAESNFQVDDYTIVVSSNSMSPGLKSGDLAVVRPTEGYDGEGLYLVDLDGSEVLRRISQTADGQYIANCDNQDQYPGYSAIDPKCLLGLIVATVSRV